MALVKSGTFGSGPSAAYELHAAQTAGSGNSRTVKVTLKLKVNGSTTTSKYGYGLSWIARVKDSYSATTAIKGNEYWYGGEGYREFSQTLTVNVGTTNSTSITVGFQLKRTDGGSTSWNQTITGTFSVDKTNTKPYFPTAQQYINVRQGGSASGTLLSGIIPENISTVYIEWGQASDAEGGTLTYGLNHRINGGNWSQIDWGTDRAHSYSIGAGNQGQTLEYYVDVQDNGGLWSDKIYSTKITKNTFTGSTLNDIASIAYNTTSLTLSWTSPSNTTSHADKSVFNFSITCDGLTLYNATASNATTSLTFKIVTSALTDGTPYILKNDLKSKFESSSYKGNLTFTLTSSNAYGSSKTSSKICAVNLQSNPSAVSSASISTDTAKSTCYQKPISSVNSYYFIPDGRKLIRVEWSPVTGNIGESISYDIYVAYGSEDWTLLQSNLTTTYYNHAVPKQTVSRTIKYRVVTKTSYGTTAYKDTATQTLHYYNIPTITVGTITRTSTAATVNVTVASRTSLSGVTTVGTWTCYNKGTSTSVSTGSLGTSQAAQNISVTSLTESGQYDLKITYKDNTVFSSNVTTSAISIGQMLPAFFVNKYGIGVNGEMANANSAVRVKGSVFPYGSHNGLTDYNSTPIGLSIVEQGAGGSSAGYPSDYITTLTVKHSNNRQFQFSVDNSGNNLYFRGAHVNNTDGTSTGWSAWKKVYHSANKPTPSDIGALPITGGTLTGKLQIRNDDANTHNSTYLELYRANGIRGSLITSHDSGLGIRLHTYNAEGNWSFNYVFNTDGTFEANKLKMGNAFLDSSTLRLEKGYGGNYSQIFFKGQTNDDGRIVHWEDNNTSQLWIMPSDDNSAASDEVILGTIANKNGTTDLNGAEWNKAFSFKMDGTMVINSKSSHTDLNGLYHESNCLTSDTAPNRPENYCYIRTFGVNDGHTLQLASYYGSAGRYYIRSQQDTSKSWKVWESIITSDQRNIYKLRAAGNYMHIETSNGAKGINWWESDIKFKNNIQIIDSSNKENRSLDSEIPGLDLVNKIKHYSFDYDETHNNTHIDCGYIAQQLEEIDERLIIKIKQPKDSIYYSEEDKYTRQPNANVIIPYLSKAIQELYVKNIELENRLKDIENSNIDLK